MSEPINLFQESKASSKTGNLTFLAKQVATWQKLTKLIQPLLPQPEQWQIACYQHGVLTITGTNQAMISQFAYLQKQYIAQLAQFDELRDLQKIQVRLRIEPQVRQKKQATSKSISSETQELLKCAADCVDDVKLNQALLRLASNKK